jgi:hypothetical protein
MLLGNSCHPSLANPTLVSANPAQTGEATHSHPSETNNSTTSPRTTQTTPSDRATSIVGVPTIREFFLNQGFSHTATEIIINARRGATYKQYATYLGPWFTHCGQNNIDPTKPTVAQAVNFMDTVRTHRNLGYSAANTTRSALSSIILPSNNTTFGNQPAVKLFLKGCYQQNPPTPKYIDTWNPNIVLEFLRQWSPPCQLDLKKLTLKVVMLVLLVSGQRIQTLTELDISFMKQSDTAFTFTIPKLLKQSRPGYKNPKIVLNSYVHDSSICVYSFMCEYIRRSSHLRADVTTLFLTFVKPHRPASKDTLSRWVKQVLSEAGVDTTTYGPHSVRAASTSAAKRGGASIQDIMDTAGWSRSGTFAKYYDKSVASQPSFDVAVLNHT